MKKIIISLLVLILIVLLIIPYIYQAVQTKKLDSIFLATLNGYVVEDDIDRRVYKLCKDYQDKNLIPDDSVYLLLEGVSSFENYLEDAKKTYNYFEENPFLVVEDAPFGTQSDYERFYAYYSPDVLDKDSRVIIEDNNYYIKYSDLDFSDKTYDLITYGNFQRYVMGSEIEGETFSERQEESPFVPIGYLKDGKVVTYSYLDKRSNSVLRVEVIFAPFYVKSCEIF